MKTLILSLMSGIIGAGLFAAFGWFTLYQTDIPQLRAQIKELSESKANNLEIPGLQDKIKEVREAQVAMSDQLNGMQQNYLRFESFLQAKLIYNYSTFVKLSNQKKLSQEEFNAVLPLLEKEPLKAVEYLKKKLNFSPNEIKSVFTVPNKQLSDAKKY